MPNEHESWEDAWARQNRERQERAERTNEIWERERAEERARAEEKKAREATEAAREEVASYQAELYERGEELAEALSDVRRVKGQLSALVTSIDALLSHFTLDVEKRNLSFVANGMFQKVIALREVLELARTAATR